jgi:hypothetical protein
VKERRKTLRDPGDIKTRVTGDIRTLNKRLLQIATEVDARIRTHAISRTPPGRILTSFYRKALNTTKAIQLLKEQRLIEEAWILLRVLLETHVNLLYFLRGDPKDMCQRYADAAVLDKLKHLRAVSFYEGSSKSPLHMRDEWEAMELEIQTRYSPQEVKAMRRNGFSGLPFENRANAVGLKTMYEACYRIASRSIHMFDPAETTVASHYAFKGRAEERRNLLRFRRQQLEFNQNMLLGRLSYLMAELIENHFLSGQLVLLGLGYEKFRDRISGPHHSDSGEPPTPPGIFWIWRV